MSDTNLESKFSKNAIQPVRLTSSSGAVNNFRVSATKSVCRIEAEKNVYGTGFLCHLNDRGICLEGLFTCYHVLNCCSGFTILFDGINPRFEEVIRRKHIEWLFTQTSNDITFIVFREELTKQLKKMGCTFLYPYENEIVQDGLLHVFQYPGGKKELSSSSGNLCGFSDPYILHKCDTEQGSSGSPILNGDYDVVGIHQQGAGLFKSNTGMQMSFAIKEVVTERLYEIERRNLQRSPCAVVSFNQPNSNLDLTTKSICQIFEQENQETYGNGFLCSILLPPNNIERKGLLTNRHVVDPPGKCYIRFSDITTTFPVQQDDEYSFHTSHKDHITFLPFSKKLISDLEAQQRKFLTAGKVEPQKHESILLHHAKGKNVSLCEKIECKCDNGYIFHEDSILPDVPGSLILNEKGLIFGFRLTCGPDHIIGKNIECATKLMYERLGPQNDGFTENLMKFVKKLETDIAHEDRSRMWSLTKLKESIQCWYERKQIDMDEFKNVPFCYLRSSKKRDAISELRVSIFSINELIKDDISEYDVKNFLDARVKDMENGLRDEVIDLLRRNDYGVNEVDETTLREAKGVSVAIGVETITSKKSYEAIIFFNTNKKINSDLFKEKDCLFNQLKHRNLYGYVHSFYDSHNSIMIFDACSTGNSIAGLIANFITQGSDMSQENICCIFKQIILGIDALHTRNIIHGSIKPSNIYVFPGIDIRIGELVPIGLRPDVHQIVYENRDTDGYDAQELILQTTRELVSTSVDIWSIGCILYEMVTLEAYGPSRNMDVLRNRTMYDADFLKWVSELLSEMLHIVPSDRITISDIVRTNFFKSIKILSRERKTNSTPSTGTANILHSGSFSQLVLDGDYVIKRPNENVIAVESLENEKEVFNFLQTRCQTSAFLVNLKMESYSNNFLSLEYCEKRDLRHIIQSQGRTFSTNTLLSHFREMIEALNFLHDNNVIHRAINPGHFVITQSNSIKIIDFGKAVILPLGEKCSEKVEASDYVAPEVLLEEEYDKSVDIWSIGCVFYELVTLKRPFNVDALDDIKNGQYNKALLSEKQKDLAELVFRILIVQSEQRLNGKELLDQVKRLQEKHRPMVYGMPVVRYVLGTIRNLPWNSCNLQ